MSAAKHTPEPWKNDCNVEITAGLRPICGMKFPFQEPEQAANASLIAAAPELLHAAERAEAFIAGFDDDNKADDVAGMLRDLRAAIAKATGSAS